MKKSLLSYLLVGAAGIALCAGNAKAQVVYVHHQAPAPAVEAAPVQTPAPVVQTQATTVTPAVSVAPAGNVQPSPVTVHDADSHFDFKANVPVSQPSPSVSVQETPGVIPSTEFGHDIPIGMAVSSIVPAGYNVQWKAMDQDKKVSWSGGRPWKDTLSTLTAANGYTMDVRGDQVIISGGDAASGGASVSPASATVTSVSPAESANAKPAEAVKVPDGPVPGQSDDVIRHQDSTGIVTQKKSGDAEVVEPSSAARYGSSHGVALETHHAKSEDGNDLVLNVPDVKARRIAAMPTASYAPNGGGDGIYYAAPGQTIDQVLQIWSNANGWSVEYDAHMLYPVDMPTTLRGDYMEVVRTLLKSVSASPKPKYRFYKGNHVLRIYNFEDGS